MILSNFRNEIADFSVDKTFGPPKCPVYLKQAYISNVSLSFKNLPCYSGYVMRVKETPQGRFRLTRRAFFESHRKWPLKPQREVDCHMGSIMFASGARIHVIPYAQNLRSLS